MRKPFPMPIRKSMRLMACGLMLGGLMACGYKGPLYLPPPEEPPASLTTPPDHETPARATAN
ncbi:MAG TPA: hypothetical protein VKZ70_11155 [Burkholderiaceae bacterium]|nr:hypothetical protein [Burkholderiaceae bacterium]